MFAIDTIIITITVMGIRASAMTIFSLSRFLSSDSLEKDWFLLALTQSTFLDWSTPGVISDISRETPSVNFALRVPPRSTYTAARNVQAFSNEAIPAPQTRRYKLTEKERGVWCYQPRVQYNRESTRVAQEVRVKEHKLQKHGQYNCYTAATSFCPRLTF